MDTVTEDVEEVPKSDSYIGCSMYVCMQTRRSVVFARVIHEYTSSYVASSIGFFTAASLHGFCLVQ